MAREDSTGYCMRARMYSIIRCNSCYATNHIHVRGSLIPNRPHLLTALSEDKFEGFQASTAEALAVQPAVTSLGLTQQPSLDMDDGAESEKSKEDVEEHAIDIYEWISLARLQSPRIASNDNIDAYLSRYQVPSRSGPDIDMWKISWCGFIDPIWFRELLIGMMKGCPSQSWFSLTALGFERGLAQTGAETTIMRLPGAAGEFMMWEID